MTLRKTLNNYVEASDASTEIDIDNALGNLQAAFAGIAAGDADVIGGHIFEAAQSLAGARERRRIMEDLLRFMTECSDKED